MFERIRTSPSLRFSAACLAYLAGTALHAARETPVFGALIGPAASGPFLTGFAGALGVSALVAFIAFRERAAFAVALACLALAGFVRYDAALLPFAARDGPAKLADATYIGRISQPPKETPYGTVLVLDPVPGDATLPGRLQFTSRERLSMVLGDVVEFRCAADVARPEPGFGFDDYLMVRGIMFRCAPWSAPTVVGRIAPSPPAAAIDALRRAMRHKVGVLYPEPDASMLMGLLVGLTDGLTRDLKDLFRQTGTSHILAVSGYNVTQLVTLMTFLLALAGLPRQRAAVAIAGIVAAFTILAGAEASVVRAACMGCTALAARMYRRRYGGIIALLAAAAGMVAVNPLVLAHDAGFQLSFLALMGLSAFTTPFKRMFAWIPDIAGIRSMAAETTAATLMTLPLILYAFGLFAPTAFFVNIMVLPFIPIIMVLGATTLLLGIPAAAIAFLPALVTSFIIRGVLLVIRAAAAWQPAYDLRFTAWALIAGYACIVLLWVGLRRPATAHLRPATQRRRAVSGLSVINSAAGQGRHGINHSGSPG